MYPFLTTGAVLDVMSLYTVVHTTHPLLYTPYNAWYMRLTATQQTAQAAADLIGNKKKCYPYYECKNTARSFSLHGGNNKYSILPHEK